MGSGVPAHRSLLWGEIVACQKSWWQPGPYICSPALLWNMKKLLEWGKGCQRHLLPNFCKQGFIYIYLYIKKHIFVCIYRYIWSKVIEEMSGYCMLISSSPHSWQTSSVQRIKLAASLVFSHASVKLINVHFKEKHLALRCLPLKWCLSIFFCWSFWPVIEKYLFTMLLISPLKWVKAIHLPTFTFNICVLEVGLWSKWPFPCSVIFPQQNTCKKGSLIVTFGEPHCQ